MQNIKARYISPSCVILGEPEIGENTWIGHFTVLDGSKGLKIGKGCSIASGVHIYTHSTHERVLFDKKKLTGNVDIGDNVVIGANSVIHYGCKLESFSMVGALSMLRPYTVVKSGEFWAGAPAEKKQKHYVGFVNHGFPRHE